MRTTDGYDLAIFTSIPGKLVALQPCVSWRFAQFAQGAPQSTLTRKEVVNFIKGHLHTKLLASHLNGLEK